VQHLSENEHDYIKGEYRLRRKRRNPSRNHSYRQQSVEDSVTSLPLKDYYSEEYINPFEVGWQERYYSELFDIDIDIDIGDERKKAISMNYLEGLEWTLSYYTTGCKDWRWTYKYHYPPLLIDMCKYVSDFDMDYFQDMNMESYNSMVQLAYVLPKESLSLLPEPVYKYLLENYNHLYPEQYDFMLAYCRYFWESHPILPNISNEVMDKWEQLFC